MLLLFLSQGTQLLYGGDELENSQMGNNNAYCQDNEIGWIDWKKGRSYSQFTGFVKDLIRFRKDHPILHMPQELRPTDYKSLKKNQFILPKIPVRISLRFTVWFLFALSVHFFRKKLSNFTFFGHVYAS